MFINITVIDKEKLGRKERQINRQKEAEKWRGKDRERERQREVKRAERPIYNLSKSF